MIKKWELKDRACELRRKGNSYKDIARMVGVSKSTVSQWCRDVTLSQEQICALGKRFDTAHKGARAVREKRNVEIESIIKKSLVEIDGSSKCDLKIVGALLYWAEGNKTKFPGVTNSDPEMIKIFMKWFREVCNVPEKKFKAHLHIHSGQDEEQMKKYWSEVTGIDIGRFGKSHMKEEGSGHKKNKLYNGTIKINICDKNLLHRIEGWIKGVSLRFNG